MAICRCTVGEVAIEACFEGARDDANELISQSCRGRKRAPTVGARTVCAAIIVGHHFDTFGAAARHDRRARCTGAQSCGN